MVHINFLETNRERDYNGMGRVKNRYQNILLRIGGQKKVFRSNSNNNVSEPVWVFARLYI